MDTVELKERVTDLKTRYSEGRFEGHFPGALIPGAIFPVGKDIYLSDFATHSLRRYTAGTRNMEQCLELEQDEIGWSCGYDEGTGKIYQVTGKKKELLLIDPRRLQVEERFDVGVENGIFFSRRGDRFFIPGLGSPHSVKIIRNGVMESSGISIESSPLGHDYIPLAFVYDDCIGLYYMDSRSVLFLKDGKFSIVHRFKELRERLYRVVYLPGGEVFLVLGSQSNPGGGGAVIHMYDKTFNFLRTFSFPGCREAGNFCAAGNHLLLSSRLKKYVAVFQYPPGVFTGGKSKSKRGGL